MVKICALLLASFFMTSTFAVPQAVASVGGKHTKLVKAHQYLECKRKGMVGCGGSGEAKKLPILGRTQ